jgi:type IV pilus assembly protein PilV
MFIRVYSNRSWQSGFSLLELLVAIVVFSVGLLGIAGLQTVSKSANFESSQRTTASQIANGLLADMRTNGNGIDVYLASGALGNGANYTEPVPACSIDAVCSAAQKATHDLWYWERALDGDFETNDGNGTGGLMLPTLCVNGPAGGGSGIYQISIAWRGTAAMNGGVVNQCGAASGNYGDDNEFRRMVQIQTFIDPNF